MRKAEEAVQEANCIFARRYPQGGGRALCLVCSYQDVFPGNGQCNSNCHSYKPLAEGVKPPVYQASGRVSMPGHTRTIVNPTFGWKDDGDLPARRQPL